jgi:hypothetical protein
MKTSPFISKSKYLNGLQCHKLLWYNYNAKEEIPEVSADTQAIFDQGHLVGEYARKIYPEGIEVAKGVVEYKSVVENTYEILREMGVEIGRREAFPTLSKGHEAFPTLGALGTLSRKPLFEAAFKYKNAYARVDILNPVGKTKWDIIEVKSSTQVKDVNLHDLALQWYVYSGSGLSLNKCYLMHINNQYVRKGEIDPKKLFVQEDVSDQVLEYLPQVEDKLEEMFEVIKKKSFPRIPIGPHCSDPYECPLTEKCWDFLPKHNPFTLYRFKTETAFSLVKKGVTDVLSFGEEIDLSEKQIIQINSIRSRRPHIDKSGIKSFLKELIYPLYYLDFETIGAAIPLFDNSKPYEQIPFQFSLHIQKSPEAKPEHVSFLAEGTDDPRPELLRLLKKHLGTNGSIITYNASFEKDKLNKATEIFTEYQKWNTGIQERIVDLLDPFRAFHYYHPSQMGSASIKAVLPALTGKGYDGMEISDGGTASSEYLRVTFGEEVSEEESRRVRKNLEEYCGLDTEGMVWIVDKLRKMGE